MTNTYDHEELVVKDPSAVPPETYEDARGISRVQPTDHAHPSLQPPDELPERDGRTPEERAMGVFSDRGYAEPAAVSSPIVGGSADAAAAHASEQVPEVVTASQPATHTPDAPSEEPKDEPEPETEPAPPPPAAPPVPSAPPVLAQPVDPPVPAAGQSPAPVTPAQPAQTEI